MGLFWKSKFKKGCEAYDRGDYAKAIEYWKKDHRNAKSNLKLGLLYFEGKVVPRDYNEAYSYFSLAPIHDSSLYSKEGCMAKYYMGRCLIEGKGVRKNIERGLQMLGYASAFGDIPEATRLHEKYKAEYEKSLGSSQPVNPSQPSKPVATEQPSRQGTTAQHSNPVSATSQVNTSGPSSASRSGGKDAFDKAMAYAMGEGVDQDHAEAIKWLKIACDAGYADAMNYMGDFYLHGIGTERNIRKALEYYLKAAERGISEAQFKVGAIYYSGELGQHDKTEGIKWIKKAADNGYADAQLSLGMFYRSGDGVEKNISESWRYLQAAADQGNLNAIYTIGAYLLLYGVKGTPDYEKAGKYLQVAYDAGEKRALFMLAVSYIFNEKGGEAAHKKGFELLNNADEKPSHISFYLGYCYLEGKGTKKDYAQAISYYLQVLADPTIPEGAYATASNNLGTIFIKSGPLRDVKKAIFYFEEATKHGSKWAPYNLALIYFDGVKEKGQHILDRDDALAFIYFKKALSRGVEEAAIYLKSDLSGLVSRKTLAAQKIVGEFLENLASDAADTFISNVIQI